LRPIIGELLPASSFIGTRMSRLPPLQLALLINIRHNYLLMDYYVYIEKGLVAQKRRIL